jgi:hypothetical protein
MKDDCHMTPSAEARMRLSKQLFASALFPEMSAAWLLHTTSIPVVFLVGDWLALSWDIKRCCIAAHVVAIAIEIIPFLPPSVIHITCSC